MLTNSLLYYFFLVYLARSKRPNTPHFVFKRIVRNFEVREGFSLIVHHFCSKGKVKRNIFYLIRS